MNPAPDQSFFKRTGRLFAFIFLGQLALIFLFSSRAINVSKPLQETFRAALQIDPHAQIPLPESLFARNPAFFALANEDNFSSAAWLKFTPPTYKPLPFSEPPAWLEVQDLEFGKGADTVKNGALQLFQLRTPDQPVVLLPPITPLLTASFFRIEGGEARNPKLLEELPTIRLSDVLRPTSLELGVSELGLVVSARILEKSGLPAADQIALRAANQLRFDPDDKVRLEWVRVLFYWHTQPPDPVVK